MPVAKDIADLRGANRYLVLDHRFVCYCGKIETIQYVEQYRLAGKKRYAIFRCAPDREPVDLPASIRAALALSPYVATTNAELDTRYADIRVPVLAVTVQVVPLPVTVVIAGVPPSPVFTSEKSPESTPVTDSLNVTVQLTLEALDGSVLARLMVLTVGT